MGYSFRGWFLIRPSFDQIKPWKAICLELGTEEMGTTPVAALLGCLDKVIAYAEGNAWPAVWVCGREYLELLKLIESKGQRILLTEVYDQPVHTISINLPISQSTVSDIIFSDYLVGAVMRGHTELLYEMQQRFRATEHQRKDRQPFWKLRIKKLFSSWPRSAYWDARINEEIRLLEEEDADKFARKFTK